MAKEIAEPGVVLEESTQSKEALDRGWNVIVWNDHVNLMSYVVFVFQRVLAFQEQRARKHMLEVHHQGKSCVATTGREKAELYWQQLQQFGLRTSIEKVQA
jgi:ATP-dependent Clp protease adaptor protein ClpS